MAFYDLKTVINIIKYYHLVLYWLQSKLLVEKNGLEKMWQSYKGQVGLFFQTLWTFPLPSWVLCGLYLCHHLDLSPWPLAARSPVLCVREVLSFRSILVVPSWQEFLLSLPPFSSHSLILEFGELAEWQQHWKVLLSTLKNNNNGTKV